jgi:hypothetical protein
MVAASVGAGVPELDISPASPAFDEASSSTFPHAAAMAMLLRRATK